MLVCRLSKAKNMQLMTVSTETVHIAKSWSRKDQSERSDLPCHIIDVNITYEYFDIYQQEQRKKL